MRAQGLRCRDSGIEGLGIRVRDLGFGVSFGV